jgi:predicted Rossmann-fold nucleotide-binding protein
MHTGELGTIMVPARPILDELVQQDAGEKLIEAQEDQKKWAMIQDGLCGLLYPDDGHLTAEQRLQFLCEVEKIRGKMHLSMLAPKYALDSASLDRLSNAGTSVVAGLIYAPDRVAHSRDAVRTVLDRSDVMSENAETEEMSIVFQGGARISDAEYQFAKQVGATIALFDHAPKKFITGGGRGIMRAPHSGAQQAGLTRGLDDTEYCGVSCGKIIAAEPPNKIIEKLAVFEQIERRLEAFTRSGQLTVLFPGGTGTFEELLYVLAVLMEEKNKGTHYSFMLVGNEDKKEYYDVVLRTLEQALGEDVIEDSGLRERICIGKPSVVAQKILEEVQKAQVARRLEMLRKQDTQNVRMDFHGGIHIPSSLREPFRITRENVAALELHRNQSPRQRITNLRQFIYTVTCACVSTERDEVAKNGPFEVHGDPQTTEAVDNLMKYFAATGRMNGGEYVQPYTLMPMAA